MQPAILTEQAKSTRHSNPLRELQNYGQSVWLDFIRRSLLTSGELEHLIDDDGLRGVTSNPAIFEKAIGGSTDYAYSVAIRPDGRIVAAGRSDNGSNNDFALVRYKTDGTLDASLNGTGKVTTPVGGSDDKYDDPTLEPRFAA